MLKSVDIVAKGCIFVPTNKDNKQWLFYNWTNLIIVCSDNGFTSSLDEDDLEDCGINKWDARELGFANGHSYTVKVIY